MIVEDDHLPRGQWKLGMVQEIMKGQDGLTRAAVVKIASRDRQHSVLRRPIQLLYPLEIHCESTEPSPSESLSNPENSESVSERVDVSKPTVRREQPPREQMSKEGMDR